MNTHATESEHCFKFNIQLCKPILNNNYSWQPRGAHAMQRKWGKMVCKMFVPYGYGTDRTHSQHHECYPVFAIVRVCCSPMRP